MRLLFVNANRSAAYGGVERWMIDAAVGLVARGHSAALLGRPRSAWLAAASHAVPGRPRSAAEWPRAASPAAASIIQRSTPP